MEVRQEAVEMESTKETQNHFSKLGWAFVIGSVVISVVQNLAVFILQKTKPEWLEDANISLIVSAVTMYLIGMPALIAIVKKIPAVELPKKRMKVSHFLLAVLMCYPIMYCSNLVGVVITTIIGLLKGSAVSNQLMSVVSGANPAVILVYMVICAPIMEEYIFRKLIVDRTVRYGQGVAIVVSGVMFGLFHGNLNQFIYATTLGMFLAFMYVKTGDLKISIGIHMIVNFMGGMVSSFLLKAVHYEEFLELANESTDPEAIMQFYMQYLPGWIAFALYAMVLVAIVITGIVLLIVFRKRFKVEKGEVVIPKGERFHTIFVNIGMLVFCLFWIGMILVQLFRG